MIRLLLLLLGKFLILIMQKLGILNVNMGGAEPVRGTCRPELTFSLGDSLRDGVEGWEIELSSYPKFSPRLIYSPVLSNDQRRVLGAWYKDFQPIRIGKYSEVFRCICHSSQQQFAIEAIPISPWKKEKIEFHVELQESQAIFYLCSKDMVKIANLRMARAVDDPPSPPYSHDKYSPFIRFLNSPPAPPIVQPQLMYDQ
ncbi:hypothetical protein VNO77_44201 [Canavalia gladiata]|uniref:Uncharacterized protein n=1 Tax=Canavalia gladiata TaxID=3824 RepID=A0AAN9PNK8_CANGL